MSRERAVDGVCELALGLTLAVVCAPAGAAAMSGGLIASGVGAAALVDSLRLQYKKYGLDNRSQIKRLRSSVKKSISSEYSYRSHEAQKAIHAADAALADDIAKCNLSISAIVDTMFEPKGFPKVATEMVFSSLREESAFFRNRNAGVDMEVATEYSRRVLLAAFEALVKDRAFFEEIHQDMMVETMRVIGGIAQELGHLSDQIAERSENVEKMLEKLQQSVGELQSDINSRYKEKLNEVERENGMLIERKNKLQIKSSTSNGELAQAKKDIRDKAKELKDLSQNPPEFSVHISWAEDVTVFDRMIRQITEDVSDWCETDKFADAPDPRLIKQIYVELDAMVMPKRLHMNEAERKNTRPLLDVFLQSDSNLAILGGPGAGKTTSMKRMCQRLIEREPTKNTSNTVMVFRLRELANKTPHSAILEDLVLRQLGISVQYKGAADETFNHATILRRLYRIVSEWIAPIVVFDGFDECRTNDLQVSVLESFRTICRLRKPQERSALHVITCRTGEFSYSIDKTRVFEIAPLNEGQIREFAFKWLEAEEASVFMSRLKNTPFYDTAIKPINISHLCAIYARTKTIPDQPASVYSRLVELMLSEWDESRSIHRLSQVEGLKVLRGPKKSKIASFDSNKKEDILCWLAWSLTTEHKTTVFEARTLRKVYKIIANDFQLPLNEFGKVIRELESHTGLFLRAGADTYEFAHKSLQEYLTALYLVRLPTIPNSLEKIESLANEFAIAVSISSSPKDYLAALILGTLKNKKVSPRFMMAFSSRLAQERPILGDHDIVGVALLQLASSIFKRSHEFEGQSERAVIYSVLSALLKDMHVSKVKKLYKILESGPSNMVMLERRPRADNDMYELPNELMIDVGLFRELNLRF